jgi:hypothetical protein
MWLGKAAEKVSEAVIVGRRIGVERRTRRVFTSALRRGLAV